MAYKSYSKGASLKQKAKKLLCRGMLAAAFAATAYNYYGTKTEVDATVISVRSALAEKSGGQTQVTLVTDKGNFDNETAKPYLKGNDRVLGLNQTLNSLQPGQAVKLSVYGFEVADFGLNRNILSITDASGAPITAAQAATSVPPASSAPAGQPPDAKAATDGALATAPVPQGPAGQPPDAKAATDSALATAPVPQGPARQPPDVKQDVNAPETCANNADLNDIAQNTPQISRDLMIMAQLPLTGKPIYDLLKDPNNQIRSCLSPDLEKRGMAGLYNHKHARVQRGAGSSVMFHEDFHAAQDVNDVNQDIYHLPMKDFTAANFLQEAAAVAYQLAAQKEAENRGLKFYQQKASVEKIGGVEITTTAEGADDRPANKVVFNAAYDKAWAANSGADAQTREAKALEAGGKAVVLRLVNGDDEEWLTSYGQVVTENANGNSRVLSRNKASPELRSKVFRIMGGVSPKLNFIPDEYLGPDADKYVDRCLKSAGITVSDLRPPAALSGTLRAKAFTV